MESPVRDDSFLKRKRGSGSVPPLITRTTCLQFPQNLFLFLRFLSFTQVEVYNSTYFIVGSQRTPFNTFIKSLDDKNPRHESRLVSSTSRGST